MSPDPATAAPEAAPDYAAEVAAEGWTPAAVDAWANVRAARPDLVGAEWEALVSACRLLDRADRYDAAADEEGLTVTGYRGAVAAHPLLGLAIRARKEAAAILSRLRAVPEGARLTNSERGRRAAAARWGSHPARPGRGGRDA